MAYEICSYSKIRTTSTEKYEAVYDITNLRIGLVPTPSNSPTGIVVDGIVDIGLRLGSEDFFDIEIGTTRGETIVKKRNRSFSHQTFSNQKKLVNSTDQIIISDKVILKKSNGTQFNYGKSAYIFWEGKRLKIAKNLTTS